MVPGEDEREDGVIDLEVGMVVGYTSDPKIVEDLAEGVQGNMEKKLRQWNYEHR